MIVMELSVKRDLAGLSSVPLRCVLHVQARVVSLATDLALCREMVRKKIQFDLESKPYVCYGRGL